MNIAFWYNNIQMDRKCIEKSKRSLPSAGKAGLKVDSG